MLTDYLPGFLQGGWNDLSGPTTWSALAACTVPALLFTLLSWQVLCYFRSPLKRYPGPFLAGTFLESRVAQQTATCVARNDTVLSVLILHMHHGRMDQPVAFLPRAHR